MARAWAMWLTLLISSLCVLLVLAAPSQMTSYDAITGDAEEERWLADGSFYDIVSGNYHLQADGPAVVELCPQVPRRLPPGGCDVEECVSDRECQAKSLMCCYNGCVYTCLPEVLPAPYFDWIQEPRRRLQYGQSWLVPGPDIKIDVETCTTTPPDDDSDPLLCPHGYECVVDDPGNPAKGIPNTGRCVKSSDDTNLDDMFKQPIIPESFPRQPIGEEVQRNCNIGDGKLLLHGYARIIDGQKCLCKETELICSTLDLDQ